MQNIRRLLGRALGRYEKRPIIEDYHKAAKTGAQIENRLYRKNERLERIVGVLAVTATRILQMRTIGGLIQSGPLEKSSQRNGSHASV